jgi:outer membrane biosynthesis protein TonB
MRTNLIISAIIHVAILTWCALSFSVVPPVSAAPESLAVDIISDTQFSQMMAGNKNAPKAETPKPMVDKIGEAKPVETSTPKVAEKPEVKPIPKEEPVEQKPPEPKPMESVAEKKPPKAEPKPDPIAEALKKEDLKKAAEEKAKAKAKAEAAKKQPKFDANQIAALLDKRDPQRQGALGDTINKEPTLGTATGSAAALSQSEIDALRSRLAQLWNPPAGALNPQDMVVKIRVKIGRDGKLAGPPMVLTSGHGSVFEAARDGAVRALFQAQPYEMLKPDHYDLWKEMEITFDPREMIPG